MNIWEWKYLLDVEEKPHICHKLHVETTFVLWGQVHIEPIEALFPFTCEYVAYVGWQTFRMLDILHSH